MFLLIQVEMGAFGGRLRRGKETSKPKHPWAASGSHPRTAVLAAGHPPPEESVEKWGTGQDRLLTESPLILFPPGLLLGRLALAESSGDSRLCYAPLMEWP